MTPHLNNLRVEIFADGAEKEGILALICNPLIKGLTTNPTLMNKIGIKDYEAFARDLLGSVPHLPISLEVFSDEFDDMERQALKIASWGENVFVKVPVTNTRGEDSAPLLRRLAADGVQLNVTALMTVRQVEHVAAAIAHGPAAYISVFAGRVADTGRDPVPLMRHAVEVLSSSDQLKLIWASPRELLNIFQADEVGCHVITVTHDVLKKLDTVGRDLDDYSLATVKMFYDDAVSAGYYL